VTVAATIAGGLAAPGYADTGGNRVVTVTGTKIYVAPATHLQRRTFVDNASRFGRGGPSTRTYPVDVTLSPNGRRVAYARTFETCHKCSKRKSGRIPTGHVQVIVVDVATGHRKVVWHKAIRGYRYRFSTDGLSWAPGGRHLYVGVVKQDNTRTRLSGFLLDVGLRKHHRARVSRIPRSAGLGQPARNPRGARIAAIVFSPTALSDTVPQAIPVVTLNPKTGVRTLIHTVPRDTDPADVLFWVQRLAWSPDGARLALAVVNCCHAEGRDVGEVQVIDPHLVDGPVTVAASGHDTWMIESPTWRTARELWFSRFKSSEDDHPRPGDNTPGELVSVRLSNGLFQAPVNRTHTPHRGEYQPSFG